MSEEETYKENSQAVQAHLGITQAVIQRMASNSASCKAWCITLVSAILVVVVDKGKPDYALLAFIPTFLFLVLDTYYLALEKMFRQSYNDFIEKLHQEKVVSSDLYALMPSGKMLETFFASLISFSIWPFYIMLLVMIVIAQKVII